MLEEMVSCARGMCGSDEIHDLAASIQMKYLQLFEKFATAYQLYSRADCMTSGDIMDLGKQTRPNHICMVRVRDKTGAVKMAFSIIL